MSKLEEATNQKSYQYLFEVESVAQDLLTTRESKLELSNARNKFREALRALEKSDDRKSWIQLGSVYIERPTEECLKILKEELKKADEDLNNLEQDIKYKLHKLRDLEYEPRLEGFTLKPISVVEAKALHRGFGLD